MRVDHDQRSHVLLAEFDGDSVLLNTVTGQYFALNDTGLAIWKLAQAGDDCATIAHQLARDFDVPHAEIRRDVQEFVAALADARLLPGNEGEL